MIRSVNGFLFWCLFLWIFSLLSCASAPVEIPRDKTGFRTIGHDIKVQLYTEGHRLEAVDRVTIRRTGGGDGIWLFRLNPGLDVSAVGVAGEEVTFQRLDQKEPMTGPAEGESGGGRIGSAEWVVRLGSRGESGEDLSVEITYGGTIYDTLKVPSFSRDYIANQTSGLIGEEGVYLGEESWWYPKEQGTLAPFTLDVVVPSYFEVVSQGALEANDVAGDLRKVRWRSANPTDVIYVVAGRYEVEERDLDGIKIYAFFFPESRDLRDTYLSATERYVRMYSEMIGPYPYEKFAVVENFFETGYGMPSFTLLGSTVIRLPFIVHTSLGHEVLHNWWGNSVFVDSTSGNWCESLTTYMADYYYKEQKGQEEAREYRMEIDKAYSDYVNTGNDFSLSTFTSRTTPATRTVGYGKGAMIYHGLRRILGNENFHDALRKFYRDHIFEYASWSDLREAFEREGGVDLGWYFQQWIDGTGAPLLRLEEVEYREGPKRAVRFVVSQEGAGSPYRLNIPVVVETAEGIEEHSVELSTLRKRFSVPVSGTPSSVSIDPDYQLFRRMAPMEIPPSLSTVLGDEEQMILLPDRVSGGILEAYKELAEQINRTREATVSIPGEVGEIEMAEHSVLVFGSPAENSAWKTFLGGSVEEIRVGGDSVRVAGISYPAVGHSFMAVFRSSRDPAKGVAVFFGRGEEDVREAGRKLVHYGKYGYLVFEGGKNVAKGSWDVKDSPLTFRFR